MKVSKLYFGLTATSLIAANAVAIQKHPVLFAGGASPLHMLRYAKIDAKGRQIGPWISTSEDFSPSNVVFDMYEADPAVASGAPTEFRTPNYSLGAFRYSFGAGYSMTDIYNDFTVANGFANGKIKRANFALLFTPPASEHLYVQIKVWDTMSTTVVPPASGFIEGYIGDYGTVAPNATNYYFGNMTLTGSNDWNIPADGSGAYEIRLLKNNAPETLSTEAQPMLYFIKTGHPELGSQGPLEWDDDTAPIGSFANSELYDYSQDGEPTGNSQPFGAMMGFYADYLPQVNPSGFNYIQGTQFSGNLASLSASDNNYLKGFDDADSLACELEVFSTLFALHPTQLHTSVEYNSSRLGLTIEVAQFNYTTNAYDEALYSDESQLTDTAVTLDFTGTAADDYTGPASQVKTKFLWYPFNDETPSQDGWLLSVDRCTWTAI